MSGANVRFGLNKFFADHLLKSQFSFWDDFSKLFPEKTQSEASNYILNGKIREKWTSHECNVGS